MAGFRCWLYKKYLTCRDRMVFIFNLTVLAFKCTHFVLCMLNSFYVIKAKRLTFIFALTYYRTLASILTMIFLAVRHKIPELVTYIALNLFRIDYDWLYVKEWMCEKLYMYVEVCIVYSKYVKVTQTCLPYCQRYQFDCWMSYFF